VQVRDLVALIAAAAEAAARRRGVWLLRLGRTKTATFTVTIATP